ncbi:hypothetical protein GGQ18_002897 [Salinibacter ruber]|nr:hypothetical protein [Salinibacter ruber]
MYDKRSKLRMTFGRSGFFRALPSSFQAPWLGRYFSAYSVYFRV